MGTGKGRNSDAVRFPDACPTGLRAADEQTWRTESEHDGLEFIGLELEEYAVGNLRLVDCRVSGRFGELKLRRSRLITSEIADVQVTTLDVAESEWSDVLVSGGRIGALLAPGSTFSRVALRGVRSNYVNLRGSSIVDLTLQDCRVGELDLATADVQRGDLGGSEVDRLALTGARLRSVDLSRTELGEIEGVAELRGSTISPLQLTRLAPALASHLGVRVTD